MSINSESNQYTRDPREQICWDFYVESILKGSANAKKSALKAGYSEPHADNITMQGWFKGRLKDLERKEMLSKAEKKLSKTLDYEVEKQDGEIKTDLLRIQVDVSKHLTSTLGKADYSNKGEDNIEKIAQAITGMRIIKDNGDSIQDQE
jgi:phage terminase small subunit